jgi:ABC-type branched-subunit amino acid transport system ATPase component
VLVGVANLRRSVVGRQLLAVRCNERAAAALGANVTAAKLYAFAAAAAIAGVAGGFLAFRTDLLTFDNFNVEQSIRVIALAVVGGVGFTLGAFTGAVYAAGGLFATAISQLLGADIGKVLILASGLLTMLIVVRAPDGLAASFETPRWLLRWRASRGSGAPEMPQRPAPGAAAALPLVAPARLVVEGLNVRFGAVHAVRDLSLTVEPGAVVGLIGPNGAGKTTFIDAVTGLVQSTATAIRLGNRHLAGAPPHVRALRGLGRTFQSNELFDDLSIRENLLVAAQAPARREWASAWIHAPCAALGPEAELVVDVLGLRACLEQRPEELSLATRRLAAIARSVSRWPSVLLLDEPAAGLSPGQAGELAKLVRRLATESGLGVLLVEHNVEFVLGCSDRVVAIDFGSKIAEGPPAVVRLEPAVLTAYLGADPGMPPSEAVGAPA